MLGLVIRQRVAKLDDRFFFYSSIASAKGLVFYLLSDYGRSAEAYRTHYKQVYENYLSPADNQWFALLRGDLVKAKALAEKALESSTNSTQSLLTLGEIALEEKDYKKALGIFGRVLQLETDQYDALLLSSVALSHEKSYGNAIDSLNRALWNYENQSRLTSFLRILDVIGELSGLPAKERPNCLLALYHRYLRIFDPANAATAISYAEKAIEAGDRPDDAHLTIGIIYSKRWDTEKALQHLLTAVTINPKNVEALRWLGIAYGNRGDLVNEYRFKKAAYEAAPSDLSYVWPFYHVLTEKLGDYQQALTVNQKILFEHPNDSHTHYRLGYIYYALGDFTKAANYFRKAVMLDPRSYSAYTGLADTLRELGQTQEAIAVYKKALAVNPSRPDGHTSLAYIYLLQNRHQEAIAEYETAFRLGEEDLDQYKALCNLYLRTSAFERAQSCFRHVLIRRSDDISARQLLADAQKNLQLQNRRAK